MKKSVLILTILLTCAGFAGHAQPPITKTYFGLRAGVNFQNLNGKNAAGEKTVNKLTTGFHAGVTADIPIAPDYFVQPALLYTTKGGKYTNDDKIVLSYIEIPLNLLYKPVLADGRLLLGFGPYAAFAVNGKYKSKAGSDSDIEFANEATPASPYTLKRFDAGANFLAGYDLGRKLSFQLNAQLGLLNIKPETFSGDKSVVKNTGFGLSLGYKL